MNYKVGGYTPEERAAYKRKQQQNKSGKNKSGQSGNTNKKHQNPNNYPNMNFYDELNISIFKDKFNLINLPKLDENTNLLHALLYAEDRSGFRNLTIEKKRKMLIRYVKNWQKNILN